MGVRKCLNCNHEQEVNQTNIYQDIKGKYAICEDCGSSFDVEIEDESGN